MKVMPCQLLHRIQFSLFIFRLNVLLVKALVGNNGLAWLHYNRVFDVARTAAAAKQERVLDSAFLARIDFDEVHCARFRPTQMVPFQPHSVQSPRWTKPRGVA